MHTQPTTNAKNAEQFLQLLKKSHHTTWRLLLFLYENAGMHSPTQDPPMGTPPMGTPAMSTPAMSTPAQSWLEISKVEIAAALDVSTASVLNWVKDALKADVISIVSPEMKITAFTHIALNPTPVESAGSPEEAITSCIF